MTTRLLYETDPYLSKFDATVTKVEGEWVVLDRTAFFPGGGGQDPDRGWIEDLEVTGVKGGEEVRHKVPDHSFTVGQRVEAEIDWERRHDLMRGHTAEHLLFSTMHKINPELELVKIAITSEKKCFFVKGEVNWNLVSRSQQEANAAIAAQLPVTEVWASKDSDIVREIRIKAERIHGDKVRIVSIGEIDKAACAGVHVQNTRELRMLLVTKLTSARAKGGDVEIEFLTGREAMERALVLSTYALQAAEELGAVPDDVLSSLANLKTAEESSRETLRSYAKESIARLTPVKLGDVNIVSGVFQGIDKKTLMDAANDHAKRPRTAVVLASVDERTLLVVASSPDLDLDCRDILASAMSMVGGKGGGGKCFATGGAASAERSGQAVAKAIEEIRTKVSGK
ncbi:MAG: DHHA1 domain-containing protein [Methanomassiliicoccales archaeon]|nr:DHHA1 domain-containing protein [Methanomassiliicoccales archaeon]